MIDYKWYREFDFRSAEYKRLFEQSRASVFQHPLWLDSIYALLVPARNVRPAILTGRWRNDGRLACVMPMVQRSFWPLSVCEYADLGVSDYCRPVVDEEMPEALSRSSRLREDLAAALARFTFMRLQKSDVEGPAPMAALKTACTREMPVHAHPVALKAPFSHWRNTALTDSFRRFLDRKRKLLTRKADIRFRAVLGADAVEAAFVALRAFHRQRWPDSLLHRQAYFDFYLSVAAEGGTSGLARTYEMTADGTPVGVLFGLADRNKFLLLMMGLDYARYRNYSIGLLMIESAIEDAIARQETLFDFTIGDEPYKSDFGAESVPLYNIWWGSSPVTKIASLAYGAHTKLHYARARLVAP